MYRAKKLSREAHRDVTPKWIVKRLRLVGLLFDAELNEGGPVTILGANPHGRCALS
jgi:hypothetical protein